MGGQKTQARPSEPVKPVKKATPKPAEPAAADQCGAPVHRAGGHVDYGDGRGWVLDEE